MPMVFRQLRMPKGGGLMQPPPYLNSPSRYSSDFNAYTHVFGVKDFNDVIANVEKWRQSLEIQDGGHQTGKTVSQQPVKIFK